MQLFWLLLVPFLFNAPDADAKGGPKTLLYKVSGNGLDQPSYLYGTIHMGDEKILDFKKPVMPAFESCEVYAMELDPGKLDMQVMLETMQLKDRKLEDFFTDEEWEQLDSYFQTNFKSPVSTFNEFSPFYVQTLIMQSQMGAKMGQAVDMHFYNQAQKRGMEVVGIETLDEQLSAINGLSDEDQKQMLMDALDADFKQSMKQMMKWYRKGDLEKLQSYEEDEGYGNDFEAKMIVDRNKVMAERVIPLMKKQSTFIGVGALHLPGDEGLIGLLRSAGYQVEPIK